MKLVQNCSRNSSGDFLCSNGSVIAGFVYFLRREENEQSSPAYPSFLYEASFVIARNLSISIAEYTRINLSYSPWGVVWKPRFAFGKQQGVGGVLDDSK